MRCYKTAAGRLANVERYLLDAGLSGEPVNDLAALVDKTTDGAETPRQMMLNLGVISTRKRTTHDRVKPLGFSGSGNPDGAQALTPMDKLANDLAALNLPRMSWAPPAPGRAGCGLPAQAAGDLCGPRLHPLIASPGARAFR